jgi:hypothetical protein
MAGRPPLPEISEAATRSTGGGLNFLSYSKRDIIDVLYLHSDSA